jgi:hypothetical protein
VVGVVVAGGLVGGGLVAGGLVAGGLVAGGLVAGVTGVGFPFACGAGPDDTDPVFVLAGGLVAVVDFGGKVVAVLAFAGAIVAGGLVVEEVVVVEVFTRVDVVLGVFAPEDVQAARSRPPATTTPSDRTLRAMWTLPLLACVTRGPRTLRSVLSTGARPGSFTLTGMSADRRTALNP